jgi:hypothetical protein
MTVSSRKGAIFVLIGHSLGQGKPMPAWRGGEAKTTAGWGNEFPQTPFFFSVSSWRWMENGRPAVQQGARTKAAIFTIDPLARPLRLAALERDRSPQPGKLAEKKKEAWGNSFPQPCLSSLS